jgi:hypothetical protein
MALPGEFRTDKVTSIEEAADQSSLDLPARSKADRN